MIDVVEQETRVSVEDAQAVIDRTFEGRVTLKDEGERGVSVRANLCSFVSLPADCPATYTANYFRELAGQLLTAAEDLDIAAGCGPEVELSPASDGRYLVRIPGHEDVDLVAYNSDDEERAVQKARQALASLTAGRPVRRPADTAGPVRLSKVGRHEFDIAGVVDVRLVVLNQACPVAAEQEAREALRVLGVRV